MKKLLTVFILASLFICCGQNQQIADKDKERMDKVCDTFMQYFSKGQYKEAVQLLKQNSVLEPWKIDTVQITIENHAQNAFLAYGKILSAEFITDRKVKDFIEKRFYILRFEKFPLKVDFTLYKSSKGWTITSFNYNEELTDLLY